MRITRTLYQLLMVLIITGCTNTVETPLPAIDTVGESSTQTAAPSPLAPDSAASTVMQTAAALQPSATATPTVSPFSQDQHPLQIEEMRQQTYPGSPITFEQNLEPGAGYDRYIISYLFDEYVKGQ